MMNTTQPALPQPERSGRPNTSISTRMTIQIQITNAMKIRIVHKMFRNG